MASGGGGTGVGRPGDSPSLPARVLGAIARFFGGQSWEEVLEILGRGRRRVAELVGEHAAAEAVADQAQQAMIGARSTFNDCMEQAGQGAGAAARFGR